MSPESIRVGLKADLEQAFTRDDVAAFSRISGDDNPIHLDEAAAREAGFQAPIVHGMLIASLFSRLLGSDLPGAGTIYLGQDMKFLNPVFIEDVVRAEVEVLEIRPDKPIIRLATRAVTGVPVVEGTAVILYRGHRSIERA